jgi:acetate kinase
MNRIKAESALVHPSAFILLNFLMPASVLTINGGSSSIKFAVYQPTDPPRLLAGGTIDRLDAKAGAEEAVTPLIQYLDERFGASPVAAIGHRIVHGGPNLLEHQLITDEVLAELRRIQPLDLAHLPREIELIEAMHRSFPSMPQFACFDTAFHRDLPRVSQLLPIPLRFYHAGLRRYGFHGLSYTYLMAELRRIAGSDAARGRIILAHLGAGASMAAVQDEKPIDTTMAFTPTAGLVMATRPGDLDPGLLLHLMREEKLSPGEMDEFINQKCGLLGVSETTADMRDLLAHRASDPRAADAIGLFCRQARKWIGALAVTLGGLDTLVFSGGIGEHAPPVRQEICGGLDFLGVHIDGSKNENNSPIISLHGSPVTVRVIPTDEEIVIAKTICRLLDPTGTRHPDGATATEGSART